MKHERLDIVKALDGAKVAAPQEPAMERVLASARATPLIPLRTDKRWALHLAVALGLTLGVLLALLQIPGKTPKPALAKLTPIRTVNADWSVAEGYVLEFEIFNEAPRPGKYYDSTYELNYKRFLSEAYKWADRHGLKHIADDHPVLSPEMGMTIFKRGGMGGDPRYTRTTVQMNLRIADEAYLKDLVETLTALPGVVEPVVSELTMYLGLGGLTPELDAAKVIINGTSFEFPEDFGLYEAQDLYWEFSGLNDGSVRYHAYPQKFLIKGSAKTWEEALSSRFKFGDVIRLALNEKGDMTIDTVKEKWELPEGVKKEDGHAKGGGWLISIPPEIQENSVDVFAELRRKIINPKDDQRLHRYMANAEVWFVPIEQLTSKGGSSVTSEQRELAARLVPKLEKTLEDWKQAHPEVLNHSLAIEDRANGGPYRADKLVYGFTAGVRTDDLAEYESLKAAISTIEGLPPIEDRITDMQPVIDRYKSQESPAPLK